MGKTIPRLKGLRRPQCPLEPGHVPCRQHSCQWNWHFLGYQGSGGYFSLDAPVTFYPLSWVPWEEELTERTQQGSMLWRLTLAGNRTCLAGLSLGSSLLRTHVGRREPTPKQFPPISIRAPWHTPKHNPPPSHTHNQKDFLKQ